MSSIYQVAEMAGVSVATVSRVINERGYVSEKTRLKVQEAINILHYTPNQAAQSLTTSSTKLIGLLVPDINNPVFLEQSKGINDYLKEKGYILMYAESGEDDEEMSNMVRRFLSNRVDGMILCSRDFTQFGDMDAIIEPALKNNVHVVLNGYVDSKFEIDRVGFDNVRGAYLATEHLLKMGHSSIALIAGTDSTISEERYRGYREAHIDNHVSLNPALVVKGDFRQHSGYEAMLKILQMNPRPTAVFAMNDVMAIGAMMALEDHKVSVPDEIAVAGFDDIIWCSLIRPRLTSVVQPKYEIGKKLAEFLLSRMNESYSGPGRHEIFGSRLAVRQSTVKSEQQ
ncbi:LacI family DNA-binding transcriptional regulator [Cohnella rhizosphaerae]|uniref:LacI family transcriptional regulator n=1 Tax=Cohnella rhizosphaerae TaxID=1457232 RepID=A0A9X4QXD4_9BACL|nr:LacI family DNA-binding transcriptional regulator [Cohnella rhizosphaerae]MDG0814720.1 LacI family transcriptional regulator [Cohnella rhizosphaerae]